MNGINDSFTVQREEKQEYSANSKITKLDDTFPYFNYTF
jgi:hypothetical protein